MKKVLLTTVHRPLGVENETCTRNISAEVYHTQIAVAQGPFSIRAICTGWSLEFIALNLNTPTTVLHYPTKRAFINELKKGYHYVGIGFVICTYPKVKELCQVVRTYSPGTKIVLGGYGTVLQECNQLADFVCREEGVNYMKRLLGEEEVDSFKIPVFRRPVKVLSIATRQDAIIPVGLGCSQGCDFCCTSHFFDRNHYPLVKTGREIHEIIGSIDFGKNSCRNIGIMDEDFLEDRKRVMSIARLNVRETEKPILISSFSSLKSLSHYTVEELLSMGLDGVWIGIESKKADYPKLKDVDAAKLISALKNVGINVLTSMIIGYDWHDKNAIEEDFQYLLSLKPALSQIMLLSPCPQTPLFNRMARENRLLNIPYKFYDGFHLLFKHPHFSPQELESIIQQLLQREYEELGPSIFRIFEIQLLGYNSLKDSPHPLFRARAREHRKLCLEIYPLLKMGIKKAPSLRVKQYLRDMKEQAEAQLTISSSVKFKQSLVPPLYYYTYWREKLFPAQQPRTEIHRFNFG